MTGYAREQFQRDGFMVRRGVVPEDERLAITAHFAGLRARSLDGDGGGGDLAERWPRMLQPHEHDPASLRLLIDDRLMGAACELAGCDMRGFQTMWYWKPPGARGQALHQDEYYVRSVGGPCIAAWLALDTTDDENGGLRVVRGSHRTPVQCPHEADPTLSTSRHEVDVPHGLTAAIVEMAAGDVLFFGGRLIHGSMPNRTDSRWRRTFVAHYLPATAEACADGYHRLIDPLGDPSEIDASRGEADPCGGPSF